MTTTKAKSNCWTCKERKVGCDRALPVCVNCTRSKRECKGYGVKLAWPDKYDGRRKQKKYEAEPERSATRYMTENGAFDFLNTTFQDLEGRRISLKRLVSRRDVVDSEYGFAVSVPRALGALPNVNGEGALLDYYDSVVARMITTVDDNTNGFRLELIPMALSSSDASSRSLLQATLALSSFHLGRTEEALKHKVQAIKSLSESFQDGSESRVAQFSTCMMLCVYSVFDASDTTWHLHLQGAKTITESFSQHDRERACLNFLKPWFDYHDILSEFSHAVHIPAFGLRVQDIVLPEITIANQKIIGLFGCSTELMRFISCINQLRVSLAPSRHAFSEVGVNTTDFLLLVHNRLVNLKQEIHIQPGETQGTISHDRITATAEFYRIASLLYLYQVAQSLTLSAREVRELVRDGLVVLDQVGVCTSPWPLFVLACNVSEDGDRIKVMRVIDEGARERRVDNYQVIKSLVQAVWKQQDLLADEKGESMIDWRDLIKPGSAIPSFI